MPKRVINQLNNSSAENLADNELVITDSGLGLKYGNDEKNNNSPIIYEFNGNEKLMAFVKSKGAIGNSNKTIQTLHVSSGDVSSITSENEGYIL